MQILPAETGIEQAVEHLRRGGLVIHPTETCYGIACDLSNLDAVKKLFTLKARPETQPVSGLFADQAMTEGYVEWIDGALDLAKKHLPGPLTIVLPLKGVLYPLPSDAATTIGVRISSNAIASDLVKTCGRPISTTSANLHGQPNPYSAEEIIDQFKNTDTTDVLLLDGGTLPAAPPSTVLLFQNGSWEVARKGQIG